MLVPANNDELAYFVISEELWHEYSEHADVTFDHSLRVFVVIGQQDRCITSDVLVSRRMPSDPCPSVAAS